MIDPVLPRAPAAKEITVVQSEFYGKVKNRRLIPSHRAMLNQPPKYVALHSR